MSEINKTLLDKAIKNCLNYKDPQTAKNYIRTWGPHIKGYNVEDELKKLEDELNKPEKILKPTKHEKEEIKDV